MFFVRHKLPQSELGERTLPSTLRVGKQTIRTDVVELGEAVTLLAPISGDWPPLPPPVPWFLLLPYGNPFRNNLRYRPVEMGSSIAIFPPQQQAALGFGTAGALVEDRRGQVKYIMSAKHVLQAVPNDVIEPRSGKNQPPQSAIARSAR